MFGGTNKWFRSEEEKELMNEDLRVEDSYDVGDQKNDQGYEHDGEVNQKQTNKEVLSGEVMEISILNGLIEFSNEKGLNPSKNKKKLLTFMKELLGTEEEFTKIQLNDKLKELKRKFKKNLGKGKALAITTPHEKRVFELSKKVKAWGGDVSDTTAVAVEPQLQPQPQQQQNLDLLLSGGSGNYESTMVNLDEKFSELGENVVEQALGQLGEAKRAKFKRDWEELQILELELTIKRAQLVQFQTEIMLQAFKKNSTDQ